MALSVFGVIFAPDAARAAGELERVVRPGGRIVVTAWSDRGPIVEVMRASHAAAEPYLPQEAAANDHFDWADVAAVAALLPGSEVVTEQRSLAFTAASPAEWVDEQLAHHPAWRGLADLLPVERLAALREELAAILGAANEEEDSMRVPAPYVLHRAEVGSLR